MKTKPIKISLRRILAADPCAKELIAFCKAFKIQNKTVLKGLIKDYSYGCDCDYCTITRKGITALEKYPSAGITRTFTYDEIVLAQKKMKRRSIWTDWLDRNVLTAKEKLQLAAAVA